MEFKKYMARIPIVPDDFENKNAHKLNELVMDFEQNDLYIKKENGYINLTGEIKNEIKQIEDGTSVIHIVTEATLPNIQDREENHWYYIITKASSQDTGSQDSTINYIYYGLINIYDVNKNYLLIAQNVTSGPDTVRFNILDGYKPCFYIPVVYNASFTNHDTGELIDYTIVDRLYAINTMTGTYNAYDVYILDLEIPNEYFVDLNLIGTSDFYVYLQSNTLNIEGLVLPDTIVVHDGNFIGAIPDPTWEDPRYIFHGWSNSQFAETIINPLSYKPEENMTLYAWFTYDDNEDHIPYESIYESSGGDGINNNEEEITD